MEIETRELKQLQKQAKALTGSLQKLNTQIYEKGKERMLLEEKRMMMEMDFLGRIKVWLLRVIYSLKVPDRTYSPWWKHSSKHELTALIWLISTLVISSCSFLFGSWSFFSPSKIYLNCNIKEAEQAAASLQMKYERTEEEKENLVSCLVESE